MGAIDEPVQQLKEALKNWDFTPAFPANYPDTYGVIVYTGNPWSLLTQIDRNGSGQTNIDSTGQMQQYLVTLLSGHSDEVAARLGDNFGLGSGGTTRHGQRLVETVVVSCWADQRLGGMDQARILAAQVHGCVLYNKNRLAGFQRLRVIGGAEIDQSGAQLYRYDVTVRGQGIVSVDY